MHVADLELCRTLFELSGWDDTAFTYYANAGKHSGTMMHRSQVFDKPENLPAYDLGFMLRKLESGGLEKHEIWNGIYRLEGTWEDRTAKLCIELIKAGILNPKEEQR